MNEMDDWFSEGVRTVFEERGRFCSSLFHARNFIMRIEIITNESVSRLKATKNNFFNELLVIYNNIS
jgi:hypothetical protein